MSSAAKVERLRAFLERGEWDQLMIRDAILEARLPSACKLTLSAIISHHSAKNTQPSVGLRRLAALASLRPNTINAALRKLEELKLLHVERGNRTTNNYDLSRTMAALLTVAPFETDAVSNEPTAVSRQTTGTVAPFETDELHPEGQLSQSEHTNCLNFRSELSQSGPQKEPGRNQGKEPTHSARESSARTGNNTEPSKPAHVRAFESSLTGPDPEDLWAFEAWQTRFLKAGAVFDQRRASCLEDRRREGMTRQDVDDALAGASVDEWCASTGHKLSVIFGDRERFESYRDTGRQIRAGTYKPPLKRGAPEPVQPRSGWKPKASAFA